MEKYYFTFGWGHPFRKHVQIIKANSFKDANTVMCRIYGRNWADQYEREEGKELIEDFSYKLLPIIDAEKVDF